MWRKTKHVAAVFLSEQTLVPKEGMSQKNVCVSFRPQTDVFETREMSALRPWYDFDSHIIHNIPTPLTLLHTLYSYKHTLTHFHLLPQSQDMNVSVPPQQFSFNGPPDNLLFSSVLLVWPLAQSLPQLSTKTQDLSPFSGGGSCKGKKKKKEIQQQPEHGFLRHHSNLELSPSFFSALFKLNPTQFSVRLYWQTMFVWWSLCCFWLLSSLKTWSGVVFRLRAFYPSYLLIAFS